MIRVLFFDLGMTLVDDNDRPFPHVADALDAIKTFVTEDGQPIAMALVSDFDMASPPVTAAKIRTVFDRYLAILDTTGLRGFFEPVQRHVTLSTHAGAFKPDRRVFEKALARLKSKAALEECLFVTENHAHVQTARTALHMRALEFGSDSSLSPHFDDWLQAPAIIAQLVDPHGSRNDEPALRHFLRRNHAFDLQGVERLPGARTSGRAVHVHGAIWKPVGPGAGKDLADVHAPFSVTGELTRDAAGHIQSVRLDSPSQEEVDEAASFVRSLKRHGQASEASERSTRAATHEIQTDAEGQRRIVRKRFRAI